ncbi:hypothetical protein HYU82_02840, partial [Candidatus Saccharibacteria bacterium]|nr:hypothetical protein [Candidatus Saccharibacteria bacterium]
GNVGTIVSFRVSPDDSPFLQKYFEPKFESTDLIQMHNRNFVISMTISGEKAAAFSSKTLNLPQPVDDLTSRIVELSRQRYGKNRSDIEKVIHEAATKSSETKPTAQPQPKPDTQPKAVQAPSATKPKDQRFGKVAAGLLRSASSSDQDQSPSKKRRRRRRSRNKSSPQKNQTAAGQSTSEPQPKAEEEHIIRLR